MKDNKTKVILTDENVTYKTMTIEYIMGYVEKNHPEDKEECKKNILQKKVLKKRVTVKDENGNPIEVKGKNGKVFYKQEYVELTEEEIQKRIKEEKAKAEKQGKEYKEATHQIDVFNAKKWFCNKYRPDLLPKKKEEESLIDKILNW